MTETPSPSSANFYEVLSIPYDERRKQHSKQDLKHAYHRALLLHHPDKSNDGKMIPSSTGPEEKSKIHTIDDIAVAYKTLSDPVLRSEYDKALRLISSKTWPRDDETTFHTGLDTIDLDDLDHDDSLRVWFRSCRCGDQMGFQITELELENAATEGEVLTGCKGCSLWLKILFALSE